jgi:hypothetical protein
MPRSAASVIFHIEPVAHLSCVAVDRQRLAGERLDDDWGIGEMIRPELLQQFVTREGRP